MNEYIIEVRVVTSSDNGSNQSVFYIEDDDRNRAILRADAMLRFSIPSDKASAYRIPKKREGN